MCTTCHGIELRCANATAMTSAPKVETAQPSSGLSRISRIGTAASAAMAGVAAAGTSCVSGSVGHATEYLATAATTCPRIVATSPLGAFSPGRL
jgi:hypothetical protein